MGASRRLKTVQKVLEKALKAKSLRAAARVFEEVDPQWFMDIDHIERLYRLVAFQHRMLRKGALEVLRVDDYLVVKPHMRSTLVKREYIDVEELIVDAARAAVAEWGQDMLNLYFDPLVAEDKSSEDYYLYEASPAGATLLYTATHRVNRMFHLNSFITAVVGVDRDTGLLFAETLPRGTGVAALLLEKELREGDVRAVRAVMGYDFEADEWRGQADTVVRLQGDLYVRVDAYTYEPSELAKRIAASWASAVYAVKSFETLAYETQRLYIEELSYLGGGGGLYKEYSAAVRALRKALAKTYPWAIEDAECLLRGECFGAADNTDLEDLLFSNRVSVERLSLNLMPGVRVNTKPRLAEALRVDSLADEGEVLVAVYEKPETLKVKTSHAIGEALRFATTPSWVAMATTVWSWLNSNTNDLRGSPSPESEMAAAYKGLVVGSLPKPLTAVRNLEAVPAIIAYAAASRALKGRSAPDEVASAVRAAGEASLVEAEVGDHRVTLEGHLLEGPTHDGVIVAEVMADLLKLYQALEDYLDYKNPLLALRASRAKKARELRLLAAAMISRLFMAKEMLLAAVATGGEIEASHPEHGKAKLELPEPALVTVTSNPAVIYTIEWFPRGAVPSYLKGRIPEESWDDDWDEDEDEL